MESMGYVWRANGSEVLAPGRRRPDYVWDTGSRAGGVVLSEAKGSTSVHANFNAVDARARDGMFGQIIPRIGKRTIEGDDILTGYSFGIFAAGGQETRTAAYEAMDFADGLPIKPSSPGNTPSTGILRRHFVGVMRLLGLDGEDAGRDLFERGVSFAIYGDERQQFVVPDYTLYGPIRPVAFDNATFPALDLKVAARALGLLLDKGEVPSEGRIDWPRYPFTQERLARGVLAIAPDGLDLVSRFGRFGGNLRWSLQTGFFPDSNATRRARV